MENSELKQKTTDKVQVEIWSDVMCPFCYIGKRNFEKALEGFSEKDRIELVWRSFQLDPSLPDSPQPDFYGYLAERKGQTREWSVKVHEQMVATAKAAGLTYDFDRAVITNSLKAHRLVQLAKTKGLGDAAEERLFKAYFTEGKNAGDLETLGQLAEEIGLDRTEALEMLKTGAYEDAVRNDVEEARQIGIRGVPFFLFDRKYAVSGAQPSEVFRQALEKATETTL